MLDIEVLDFTLSGAFALSSSWIFPFQELSTRLRQSSPAPNFTHKKTEAHEV